VALVQKSAFWGRRKNDADFRTAILVPFEHAALMIFNVKEKTDGSAGKGA
jgi:hypothetical protein